MSEAIKTYLEEFKKHYRYSPTQLGKIERIGNYIFKLETKNKEAIDYIKSFEYYIPEDDKPDLLNILGGDSVE